MARVVPKTVQVRVKARTSFNEIVQGDEATLELTPKVQGWINAGLVEVVNDGEAEAGPGSAEPDDNERVTAGADRSVKAGRQPGKGFGAGGYGAAEGQHQG